MLRAPLDPRVLVSALALTTALSAARSTASADEESAAFIEWEVPEGPVFVGQRVTLPLRFGIERELFEERLVPLFAQELELPVQLEVAWQELSGCVREASLEGVLAGLDGAGPELVVGGVRVRATGERRSERAGSPYFVVELALPLTPTCPGTLALPQTELVFAYAEEFERDIFGESRPTRRRVSRLASPAAALEVLPLPESGRPVEFRGAVGSFRVESSLGTRSAVAGEHVKLEIEVTGEGDLAAIGAPPLLPGPLREFGVTVQREPDRVRFVYDLLPEGPGEYRLGAAVFASFDPRDGGEWRREVTDAGLLLVRPARESVSTPEPEADSDSASPGSWTLVTAAVVAALLALLVGSWRLWLRRARESSA